MKKPKIIVTMPAFKAAKTVEKTYREIPPGLADEVILVDDASPDDTVKIAEKLGIEVIEHKKNLGYGGNQKTCYDTALERGADIIVLLHPDYQYEPKMLTDLVKPILEGRADFTFGSRFAKGGDPLAGGMPLYRYIGNRVLTGIENVLLGTNFTELHSGYKAYSRRFLEMIPYHTYSNKFVFDSQMVIDAVLLGFMIVEIPILTRYTEESSSVDVLNSLLYVAQTLGVLVKRKFIERYGIKRGKVACHLCGSKDIRILYKSNVGKKPFRKEDFFCTNPLGEHDTSFSCKSCGLVFSRSETGVNEKEIIKLYREAEDKTYLKELGQRERAFRKSLEWIEHYKRKGTLLEVGAGIGLFLKVAKEDGWEVEGLEPSRWAADYGRKNFGVEIQPRTLAEVRLSGPYDVVVMWDVLEHLVRPLDSLMKVNCLLRDDGLLFLSTVNIASFAAKVLGSRWPWLTRSHLFYFTPKTLAKMLEKAGFKVLEMKTKGRTFSIDYLLKERLGSYHPIFHGLERVVGLLRLGGLRVRINFGDILIAAATKEK